MERWAARACAAAAIWAGSVAGGAAQSPLPSSALTIPAAASAIGPPQQTELRAVQLRDLIELRDASGLAISPAGDLVAFRVHRARIETNDHESAWFVLPTHGDGEPTKLGSAGEPDWTSAGVWRTVYPAWSPDGQWLAYPAIVNGEKQIWRSRRDGRVQEQVTRSDFDVESFVWSPDGRTIVYAGGATRAAQDEYRQREWEQGTLYDRTVRPKYGIVPIFPYNGRRILARHLQGDNDSDFLPPPADAPSATQAVDVATGTVRDASPGEVALLTPADKSVDGRPSARLVVSAPDATRVAFLDSERPGSRRFIEAQGVPRYGLSDAWTVFISNGPTGKRATACALAQCTGVIEAMWWANDASELYFWRKEPLGFTGLYAVQSDGSRIRTVLRSDALYTGASSDAPPTPCPVHHDKAVCVRALPDQPAVIVAIELRTGSEKLLLNLNPEFRRIRIPQVERIEWVDSFGTASFGYLALPAAGRSAGPYPLVIATYWCRGFMRGAVGNEYPILAFAEQGMAALCFNTPMPSNPDAGGSAGVKHRGTRMFGASVSAAIRRLAELGVAREDKVGIGGLSYGAARTAYMISRPPDRYARFAAAVISTPPVDPIYYHLSGPAGSLARLLLSRSRQLPAPTSAEALEEWREISPALNAAHVHAPLLMQLADHEFQSALQLYDNLQDLAKPVEMIIYPDEFHIKRHPKHKLHVYSRNVDWFRFWLKHEEDADPAKAEQYARWRKLYESWKGRTAPASAQGTTIGGQAAGRTESGALSASRRTAHRTPSAPPAHSRARE